MEKLVKIARRRANIIAAGLLGVMLVTGLLSMAGDSGIVDEVAHIPAGYSYLRYGDFRLNPEHPPLIKDLAALPLMWLKVSFPDTIPAWTTDANGQWETGWHFIYHQGNDADQILFWSRLPILLLAVVFGWILFSFARSHFGRGVALMTTGLYAFSPSLLAHARLVTTDLGITVFGFVAFMAFWRWAAKPTWRQVGLLGGALALAQLAKFSAALLLPFFGLMTLVVIYSRGFSRARLKTYLGSLFWAYALAGLLVWLFYIPHTLNMPAAVQDRLIEASLEIPSSHAVKNIKQAIGLQIINHNDTLLVKSLGQYVLGVLMVFNRVASGNTTYFLGQVTNQSFATYFPFTWLVKNPLAQHVLSLIALAAAAVWYLQRQPWAFLRKLKQYAQQNLIELASVGFIALYSYFSITGNLNLGIRHLLPIFPFVFILIAKNLVKLWRRAGGKLKWDIAVITIGLSGWYAASSLAIFPSYIAYFNELPGGAGNAYKYLSDSSVDWGQDLRRLQAYVEAHPEIDRLAVDYFGGGEPRYYFCDRRRTAAGELIKSAAGYDCSHSKYLEWHAEQGLPPTKYIAVSETFLMNDLYWAPIRGDQGYSSLRNRPPIAKIGYSIYLYQLH